MRAFKASLVSSVVATQNSGVKKVITLLGDLKGKVESETAQGKADAADYEDWCIKTITETKADIKYGAEKVEENEARAEDGAAKAQAGAADAAALGMEIGKAQASMKTAAASRKEDHSVFQAKEAELVEADSMLAKAYSVLKRSLSFAQGANVKADPRTEEVVVALGAIINSAASDPSSVKQITSFLEEEAPQASVSNYESKSGGILTAIQGMQDKNAQVLAQLRDKEMSARHDHELLMQDLTNTVESKDEQMSAAKEGAAKAESDGKAAAAVAAEASEVLAADKAELANTQNGCDTAAKEWSARLAEATEEMQVLAQAVEILEGKFGTALIQTGNKSVKSSEFQRREKASAMLRKLGREYNQYGLLQAAQSASDDAFVKVRQMITDMVAKLEEESRKEANKEAKCKADKQKGATDLKIKKGDFEKLGSRLDGAKAKFVLLGDEIADLEQQLKDLAISVQAATQFRTKESKDNKAAIQDSAESVEALSSAIGVLTDFYGAPALLQTGAKKQGDSASVIIDILQTAQEDFEKLKQDTELAESSSATKYENEMQAAEVSKAKKTAMVEGKTAEKSTTKVMISQISEDLSNATKAYDAAKDFLKGVMEACANKAMSFEERQARREAEIAGLKDALEILSPEAEFIQTRSFLAKN